VLEPKYIEALGMVKSRGKKVHISHKQTNQPTNKQTGRQASKQANKHANMFNRVPRSASFHFHFAFKARYATFRWRALTRTLRALGDNTKRTHASTHAKYI